MFRFNVHSTATVLWEGLIRASTYRMCREDEALRCLTHLTDEETEAQGNSGTFQVHMAKEVELGFGPKQAVWLQSPSLHYTISPHTKKRTQTQSRPPRDQT